MRLLTIGLLSVGLGVGACIRADTAENGNRPPQPIPVADAGRVPVGESGSAADASRLPVATTGTSNAAPAARRLEWREVTIPAGTRLPVILDTPGRRQPPERRRHDRDRVGAREGPGPRRGAVRYTGADWRGSTIQHPNRDCGSDSAIDEEEGRPRDRRARGGRRDHRRRARREKRGGYRDGGRRRCGRRGCALDARKRDSSSERRRAHTAAVSAAHGEGPQLTLPVRGTGARVIQGLPSPVR